MSATRSEVYLRDGATGEVRKAILVDQIEPAHLEDFEKYWKPILDE